MKKLIIDISKMLGAVATISAGALWLDARFDASEDRDNEMIERIEYNSAELNMIGQDFEDWKDSIDKIEGLVRNNAVGIYTNRTIMQYEREHRGEYSPEQMNDILNQMQELLKKNGIASGSTTEPESMTLNLYP